MNRVLVLFFGVAIFLGLVSCSGADSYTVGYLSPASFRERFKAEGNFMAERLRELGHEVVIKEAEDDDALQLVQGYELLEQGVDVLVIACVNGNTIAPLVRDAKSQGVKVVAYNRLINNSDYDLYLTGNNASLAGLFCETALEKKPRGNYVLLNGDRFDRNGFELKQYIDSILAPHIASGAINILYDTYVEGWNGERAGFELQQVIDAYGTDIDAVITCSDPMGLAAVEVLRNYDLLGEVVVTGQDAILEAVRKVYQGEMTMTVYHPHRVLGYRTAELVDEMLKGRDISELATSRTNNGFADIVTFKVPSQVVTPETIEEVLIESGQYTWSDIR